MRSIPSIFLSRNVAEINITVVLYFFIIFFFFLTVVHNNLFGQHEFTFTTLCFGLQTERGKMMLFIQWEFITVHTKIKSLLRMLRGEGQDHVS